MTKNIYVDTKDIKCDGCGSPAVGACVDVYKVVNNNLLTFKVKPNTRRAYCQEHKEVSKIFDPITEKFIKYYDDKIDW